jgi:hypothetical protein
MDRCPHCGKVPYPALDESGKPIWKNILRIDWLTVLLVIGIISLLFGFQQINEQCYEIVSDPCGATADCRILEGFNVLQTQTYPTGSSTESNGED